MAPLQPLRVLLVEDNLINQKVASRMLEKNGHNVITANNARKLCISWESGSSTRC